MKHPLGDLNPNPCPPHPPSTYTCGVITASRVYGDENGYSFKSNVIDTKIFTTIKLASLYLPMISLFYQTLTNFHLDNDEFLRNSRVIILSNLYPLYT